MAMAKNRQESNSDKIEVVRLWKLPDDFFVLPIEEQWNSIKEVSSSAPALQQPREPCHISYMDDALATTFFFASLCIPIILSVVAIGSIIIFKSKIMFVYLVILTLILALHPMPKNDWRHSRLALALIRYFTLEVLIDRDDPLMEGVATPKADDPNFVYRHGPYVCLACPHGVFNYGAIIWCCVSRWFCGREQYTGAANIVKYVPGLRYMDRLIWAVNADRKTLKKIIQQESAPTRSGGMVGGMLGMVPDGIAGAFRARRGFDDLLIGKRRGIMRICSEEGAILFSSWFWGTSDLFTTVYDPFGIMEYMSRKMQAGMLLFYGRWYLPVPRRIPITMAFSPHRCLKKLASPTKEQVEEIHNQVYGKLQQVYEKQKIYAGYPERVLNIE